MSDDLKQIKKLYGEAMMHFCRDSFSTILEERGRLLEILQNNFAPSHELYDDLVMGEKLLSFKNYINDIFFKKDEKIVSVKVLDPVELMRQAGYKLFECKTEEDIQMFKKYYAKGEALCTFHGGRLRYCYVFFAVKENVNEIKRENFSKPERQDLYGTSVISIQFSKDNAHTLSIKNRYNHTVNNPDATFGNDLDNIIESLTVSFEKYYGLKQEHKNNRFEIIDYVRANDGRWYKYNLEIDNIYYCPGNIIIDNGKVKRYEKEKYIVMDCFILDLTQKVVYLCDEEIQDSFPDVIGKIKKITVVKNGSEKEVRIINETDEEIVIKLNKRNQIVGFKSKDIKQIGDDFLTNNLTITDLNLPNLTNVGDNFLCTNMELDTLDLPSLQQVGDYFLSTNHDSLVTVKLPELQRVGNYFLSGNMALRNIELPKLKEAGNDFINDNQELCSVMLPELVEVGHCFLFDSTELTSLFLPSLKWVGDYFLYCDTDLCNAELPSLQQVGKYFFTNNQTLREKFLEQIKNQHGFKR